MPTINLKISVWLLNVTVTCHWWQKACF
uniref:Uncharacterized protein n=1 Tax=Arundo donax TaxID=35708 RepID=A0A0A9BWE0_ARUDO